MGLGLLLIIVLSLLSSPAVTLAQDGGSETEPPEESQECLVCHDVLEAYTTFLNGEKRDVQVHPETLLSSVHTELACQDCHGDYEFPHENEYESARDFRLSWTATCETCHSKESDLAGDSVHALAQQAGNENAATCTDCHSYHDVQNLTNAEISQTCGTCHTSIFDLYKESVHGEAVLEGNSDAPTCINCHGVHDIQDPTTNLFRVRSPLLCATCHEDVEMMEKYDISTHVFESYVSDFHGTTVTLFEQQSPDAEVNQAVCYDCHGVHDIRSPDDPESQVIKENLAETCQKCHPDASADFAAAWTKHYEPSPTEYPLVFFVDQFYKLLIPGVLGFMTLFVLTDIGKRISLRLRRIEDDSADEDGSVSDDSNAD
jgi:predicted CXXCH cytochrome family protein